MTKGAKYGPSGGAPNGAERSTDMRSVKDAKRGTGVKKVHWENGGAVVGDRQRDV